MTKYLFTLLLNVLLGLCALNLSAGVFAAEAPGFGGMSPEVIAAIYAIDMDAEQKPKFGAAMMDFSAQVQSTVSRVMRSKQADKPRVIKRKMKGLFNSLDKSMKEILREDQWPAYLRYKETFSNAM